MTKTNFFFLIAAIAVLLVSSPAQANNVLTLFDGDEFGYAPIDNAYLDEAGTRTQLIYPAQDLAAMTNEVINSMTFYTSEPLTVGAGQINVLVGETTKTSFYGGDYVEDLTPVATISMPYGASEVVITFDNPYLYKGGNLVVETYIAESTVCCFIPFTGYRASEYTTMSRGEVSKFLPKATFNYGTSEAYSAKVIPDELTFNTIRAERTDVQSVVLTNNGQNAFTATVTATAPFAVDMAATELQAEASVSIPVTFAPTAAGDYTGQLTIDCGQAGVLTVNLLGTAKEAATDVIVGSDEDYAGYLPIYGTDIDIVGTRGQMIYPDSLLADMKGATLVGLKFITYKTVQMSGGVIQLSLKQVDNYDYDSPTMVDDGLTAVATVVPVYNSQDLEFEFTTPFKYEGGNLLVDCEVIEAGTTNYRQTFFYGNPTANNVAVYSSYYYNGMETEFVPFLPMAMFTYQKADVLRGDVNLDGRVNITDASTLINYLLTGESDAIPDEGDCNLDGKKNITDVLSLINYISNGSWAD